MNKGRIHPNQVKKISELFELDCQRGRCYEKENSYFVQHINEKMYKELIQRNKKYTSFIGMYPVKNELINRDLAHYLRWRGFKVKEIYKPLYSKIIVSFPNEKFKYTCESRTISRRNKING